MVGAKLAPVARFLATSEVVVEKVPFNGAGHLAEAQRVASEVSTALGRGMSLHPGDLAHRIYNGLRAYDPKDVVGVWRDADGLAAMSITWPKWSAFDLCVRPDLGDGDLAAVIEGAAELAGPDGRCETDAVVGDTRLVSAIEAAGFARKHPDHTAVTGRDIPDPIEVPETGFTLRSASVDDVAELVEVHMGAFGGERTVEGYAERMTKPGYDAERELVAVADDGRFAGFAIVWFDKPNRVGSFEPVGVHSDFHRRGVGSALMWEGMRRMADAGMTYATVMHELADPRSSAFYASLGFDRLSVVGRWERVATG